MLQHSSAGLGGRGPGPPPPPPFLFLLSLTRSIFWLIAKIDFLLASSITNTVLKGELFITASPSLIDAFELIVKDEEAIIDAGASTRTRSKRGHLRKKYFSIFLSPDSLKGNDARWDNTAPTDHVDFTNPRKHCFFTIEGHISISTLFRLRIPKPVLRQRMRGI